eukprot:TRINITY_DN21070_c0_g1_i1.p1 TRINITY_DN21070_c0_g1~~TRINITY_DN21070_c0_g1_i1.p1  ORF type:complete len:452 (+),score=53.91 TRINITY_DN21070_c0_g1_i1:59-1357(+)
MLAKKLLHARRWTHKYAEALVSFQNKSGGSGTRCVEELLEATGRPGVDTIHRDLKQRGVVLTDAHRGALLFGFGLDTAAEWRGCDPDLEETFNFFKTILPPSSASPSLFTQIFNFASYTSSLDLCCKALTILFTSHRSTGYRSFIHATLHLCDEIGGEKAFTTAFRVTSLMREHDISIDPQTTRMFLVAVGHGGDTLSIQKGIEELETFPFMRDMLRRSPQFYTAILQGYVKLGEKIDFETVDGVFMMMEEEGVAVSLDHYAQYVRLCMVKGEKERGIRVLEDALGISQTSKEESNRFEVVSLLFYTHFGMLDSAECSITRAAADGKLESSPDILLATLSHLSSISLSPPFDLIGVQIHHQHHASWRRTRTAFLEYYSCMGDLVQVDLLLNEIYTDNLYSLTPARQKSQYRKLFDCACVKARELSEKRNEGI